MHLVSSWAYPSSAFTLHAGKSTSSNSIHFNPCVGHLLTRWRAQYSFFYQLSEILVTRDCSSDISNSKMQAKTLGVGLTLVGGPCTKASPLRRPRRSHCCTRQTTARRSWGTTGVPEMQQGVWTTKRYRHTAAGLDLQCSLSVAECVVSCCGAKRGAV